jgi:hypothetical protein
MIALFKVKTVNFAELATAFSGLDPGIGHLASIRSQQTERLHANPS